MEVSNLYAAFVWLAARMLAPGGETGGHHPTEFLQRPLFSPFPFRLPENDEPAARPRLRVPQKGLP